MTTPELPPTDSVEAGRRWLRRKDAGPTVEELEARIGELTATSERFASLRAAAEKAASEATAERISYGMRGQALRNITKHGGL